MLKRTQEEAWVNNGGGDFSVNILPPSAESIVGKVVNAEATYTHWSLFNRFCLALELLDGADSVGACFRIEQLKCVPLQLPSSGPCNSSCQVTLPCSLARGVKSLCFGSEQDQPGLVQARRR